MSANGNNANDNPNNKIYTIKDTKFYVPIVTLSAKDNQKLLKWLSKEFEKSNYRVGHKKHNQNSKKKINKTTNAIEPTFCMLIPLVMFNGMF